MVIITKLNKEYIHLRHINGYRAIKCPDHPFARSDGFIYEHRIIAEQYLLNEENSVIVNGKRYLSFNFAVHHINFNRLNNDPKNLLVIEGNEHRTLHRKLYDKQYFLNYCKKFNLDPDITRKIRADFKSGHYKKYR